MENKVLKPKIRFKGFTDTWEQRKLEGIYKFQYGEFNNNPSNGGIYPVYGANGIIGGYTNYNAENSVIIGHMGEYAGSVLWGNGKHFVTYNGTISKPRGENVVSKFGYYMLYQKDINKICGGSGLPFLSYEQLNKIEVCYPKDIKEQKSIANYLTNIDNLITLHQSKYDKLVNVKKALLEKMFPKDGKNVPEIRFKGFTDTWEQRKLKDESDYIVAGGDIEKNKIDENGKYPVIANALTNEGIVGYYKEDYRIKAPAVTVTGRGDVGHAVARNIDFTPVVRLLTIKSKHYNYFLENAINNLNVVVESTGVPQLTVPQLENYEIQFPKDLNEETQIGNLFKQIDNLITLHQHKLEKLKNMKKSLLNKMFI